MCVFAKELDTYLIFLGFALIHELSHLLFAVSLRCNTQGITILPFGAMLEMRAHTRKAGAIVAMAGPLLSGLLGVWFYRSEMPGLGRINLLIALVNLIPATPLDGGTIIAAFLDRNSCRRMSELVGVIMITTGIGVAFFHIYGVWIAVIGVVIMLESKRCEPW